jgi:hypothetical protein
MDWQVEVCRPRPSSKRTFLSTRRGQVVVLVVMTSRCLLVNALSVESARRLVDELAGLRAEVAEDGSRCVVAIELDRDNDGWLDGVLSGVPSWLAGSAMPSCRVQLDGRSYVLERPAP